MSITNNESLKCTRGLSMLSSIQLNAEKLLNYYFCDQSVLEQIRKSKIIPDYERKLIINYLQLKNRNYKIKEKFGISLVSLGCNCYPHTVGIRLGYKLPKWLSQKDRALFDLGIVGLQSVVNILDMETTNLYFADDYDESQKWFLSKKYGFKWNHDFVDKDKTKEENLYLINNLLNHRLISTKETLKEGNCLVAVVIFKKYERLSDILKIKDIVEGFNATNHLLIIDPENILDYGDNLIKNGISFVNMPYPKIEGSPFVWFSPNSYLTESGYEYYKSVSDKINQIVSDKFSIRRDQDANENMLLPFVKTIKSPNFCDLINKFAAFS